MSTKRTYPLQRAIRITARTVHIGAAAFLIGAAVYGGEPTPSAVVLLASGSVIVADDLYKYGEDYFRFVQSWAVVVKLALVVVGISLPSLLLPCLLLALVVGSLISHAPGSIRHRAMWGEPGPCAGKG